MPYYGDRAPIGIIPNGADEEDRLSRQYPESGDPETTEAGYYLGQSNIRGGGSRTGGIQRQGWEIPDRAYRSEAIKEEAARQGDLRVTQSQRRTAFTLALAGVVIAFAMGLF